MAVHAGLEALFRGQDYERAFLLAWREYLAAFPVERFPGIDALRGRGLEVLDCVRNLGLVGEPERQIIMTRSGFIIPFFGYADLWDPDPSRPRVVDFKTSGFGWTQKKADDQLFQPAIYSQAYLEEYGQLPVFEFVVLPRIPAPIQVLDASRSRDQIDAAFDKAFEIHCAIEDQEWGCTCGGRYHLFDPDEDQSDDATP